MYGVLLKLGYDAWRTCTYTPSQWLELNLTKLNFTNKVENSRGFWVAWRAGNAFLFSSFHQCRSSKSGQLKPTMQERVVERNNSRAFILTVSQGAKLCREALIIITYWQFATHYLANENTTRMDVSSQEMPTSFGQGLEWRTRRWWVDQYFKGFLIFEIGFATF